jgi:hypothetical protein
MGIQKKVRKNSDATSLTLKSMVQALLGVMKIVMRALPAR